MSQPNILIVGSINLDTVLSQQQSPGVNGISALYGRCDFANGGKGTNQASAVAKLGGRAALVGCVGDDDAGGSQLEALEALGVDTTFVRRLPGVQTGRAFMMLRPDKTYTSANIVGANGFLVPQYVEAALDARRFDLVIMQLEMPLETVYRTYELARDRGVPVIFDPGPARSIPLERFEGIFILTPNEDETEALTGVRVRNRAGALRASRLLWCETHARYILLKLGARGAYLFDGGRGEFFPAFPIEAVDSTGAGDSFTAELGLRLCLGEDIRADVLAANAAGAICASRMGGQPAVPTQEEVRAFLERFRETPVEAAP